MILKKIEKYEVIVISGLLLFSLLFRLSLVTVLDIEPISDYAAYLKMAASLIDTGIMDDGQGNLAFYSSGYPLFLVPFFAIFGTAADVAQMLNALLGAISTYLIYLCAREVLPSFKWALVPSIVWCVYPPGLLYMEYVAKENLMVVIILLQVLLLLIFRDCQRKLLVAFLLGIIFSFGLLVGPAIILTGIIIAVFLLRFPKKYFSCQRYDFKPIIVFFLACLIGLSPWLFYTSSKLGKPVLNTNGSFNLYLGNNPSAEVYFVGIQHTPVGPTWSELKKSNGELGAMSYLKDEAIKYILENPAKTLMLSIKKVFYFWTPPYHEGKDGNKDKKETIVRFAWLISYLTIIVGFISIGFFWRRFRYEHIILFSTVLFYTLIHGVAYVIFRYRIPIMPIVIILSSCGLYWFLSWWQERRHHSQ